MSQRRGGGGGALTHAFSMPGPAARRFSREDLERKPRLQARPAQPPQRPRFQMKASLFNSLYYPGLGEPPPPSPSSRPSHPRAPWGSASSVLGSAGGCLGTWSFGAGGCWSLGSTRSGLSPVPSGSGRGGGRRRVPQPQQPQSLRDEVPRVAPEKHFRAGAPGMREDNEGLVLAQAAGLAGPSSQEHCAGSHRTQTAAGWAWRGLRTHLTGGKAGGRATGGLQ